jgi:acetate kinase
MTGASILVLNAGSSNLKCARFAAGAEGPVRLDAMRIETSGGGDMGEVMAWAEMAGPVQVVGHRVVHGGERFHEPAVLSEETMAALEALSPLAPLHQPQSLAAVRAIAALRPGLLQVACFDTAFHRTLPPAARRLGLPREWGERGMRRYGFHGLSYEYLCSRLRALDPALAAGRVVLAHLGAGSSLCAVRAGVSVETTMGFSALDGLVMATRCGALDPGAVLHLIQREGVNPAEVEQMLYHRSGLLGVSGVSGDMRVLLASTEPGAAEAVDLFVHAAVKQIGAMAAALDGLEGVVFTGGVGENSAEIRAAICGRLAWLGLELDAGANHKGGEGPISSPRSRLRAWLVPTDEEQVIARAACVLVERG